MRAGWMRGRKRGASRNDRQRSLRRNRLRLSRWEADNAPPCGFSPLSCHAGNGGQESADDGDGDDDDDGFVPPSFMMHVEKEVHAFDRESGASNEVPRVSPRYLFPLMMTVADVVVVVIIVVGGSRYRTPFGANIPRAVRAARSIRWKQYRDPDVKLLHNRDKMSSTLKKLFLYLKLYKIFDRRKIFYFLKFVKVKYQLHGENIISFFS